MLQSGDESEADRLAVLGDLGGVGGFRGDAGVGGWGHPGDLMEQRSEMRLLGGRSRAHLHRSSPALDVPLHVDAHVGGDPVEPGPHARATLEGVGIAPCPQHGLLHRVLGLEARTEHAVAVGRQLAPERLEVG